MPADVAPLVADGGNIRLVRRVAAYAYGSRDVTWPEGAEDPKDELPDGREFGWVAQLGGPRPGLSGRRFVRTDAVIDAVEGVSNTEQLLDDAAQRTGGDVQFETLISGRGLAGQEPGVDFRLGDRVPARFWGRLLPGQLVTEVGWDESGPYAKLGGQMLRDLDALARTRAELTRTIRREREETAGAVEAVRSYADSAVAVERTERRDDVASVREVLGGARADEGTLVGQLAAVQAQITGMVGDGETPPPAGLLNSYLWMNTRLWEAQDAINRLNGEFQAEVRARQRDQAVLDARQDAQAKQLALAVPRVASIKEGENESAENDFFRLSISGRDPNVRDNWVFNVELKRGWEGSMIVLVRSDVTPMKVHSFMVSRDGLVAGRPPSDAVSGYAFSCPREGLSLVAIGVANPPV